MKLKIKTQHFPISPIAKCCQITDFWPGNGSNTYNFQEVFLMGECPLFFSFLSPAGLNAGEMAGAGATILDLEMKMGKEVCVGSYQGGRG